MSRKPKPQPSPPEDPRQLAEQTIDAAIEVVRSSRVLLEAVEDEKDYADDHIRCEKIERSCSMEVDDDGKEHFVFGYQQPPHPPPAEPDRVLSVVGKFAESFEAFHSLLSDPHGFGLLSKLYPERTFLYIDERNDRKQPGRSRCHAAWRIYGRLYNSILNVTDPSPTYRSVLLPDPPQGKIPERITVKKLLTDWARSLHALYDDQLNNPYMCVGFIDDLEKERERLQHSGIVAMPSEAPRSLDVLPESNGSEGEQFLGLIPNRRYKTVTRSGEKYEGVIVDLSKSETLWHMFITIFEGGEFGTTKEKMRNGYPGEWDGVRATKSRLIKNHLSNLDISIRDRTWVFVDRNQEN